MNEFKRYIEKYLSHNNIVCLSSEKTKGLIHLIDIVLNSSNKKTDPPDGYFVDGNIVYIIEHFSFNSSKFRKGKGTEENIKSSKIIKNIEKQLIVFSHTSATIDSKRSTQDYVFNLMYGFNTHYDKIENYKQIVSSKIGINQEDIVFKVIFVIEDSTSFGNMIINSNTHVFPWNTFEFLDYITHKKEVDFYLCSSELFDFNKMVTYLFSKEDINELIKNSIELHKEEMVELPVHVIGNKIFIPF